MRVRAQAFRLPKAGNTEEEYEDACWPEGAVRREARLFRCAVADGATEASFAGLWARLLVRAYCRAELSSARLPISLRALASAWDDAVASRPLPWYAEEKARAGAFAALAGLTMTVSRGEVRWRALAIGDSCIFHLRGGALIAAFPLQAADDFDNRPYLLGSKAESNGQLRVHVRHATGRAQSCDRFLLMTDALAAWALRSSEAGDNPWEALSSAAHDEEVFRGLIGDLRTSGDIRNDDVTLMTVDVA
jgi:serine/threonine protein phosphatase PrpC